jgi:hypothetical protein
MNAGLATGCEVAENSNGVFGTAMVRVDPVFAFK